MKNRNFNCSIRFVPSNTNHHQSYHKTIHCQPKLSLVTAKFQCLRNKIVMHFYVMIIIAKSPPPTLAFVSAKKSKSINVIRLLTLKIVKMQQQDF